MGLARRSSQSAALAERSPGRDSTIEYIGDVCHELRKLASGTDLDFVAYLLEMAHLECLNLAERRRH